MESHMDVPEILKIPLESCDRNARVNRVTLATITPSDLRFGDSAGGFNIGQHLADIINFRPDWLSRIAPHHVASLPSVVADDSPTWLSTDDIGELQAAIDAGDAAIRAAVLEAVGEGRSFERVYQTHP